MFERCMIATAGVACTLLLHACAAQPSESNRMLKASQEAASLAEGWEDGKKMVEEGQRLIEEGESNIVEGRQMIVEGNEMMATSEKRYRARFPLQQQDVARPGSGR
jgi:hypothetical protein